MPRDAVTSSKEKVVKKTPRKRAVSTKTAAAKKATPRKATARKTTPRKTVVKKVATKPEVIEGVETEEFDESEVEQREMTATRKAPTRFAAASASKRTKRNQMIVIAVLLLVGIGSSAVVGLNDTEAGRINVAQTIKERNERMDNLVDVDGPVVIAPTPSSLPDGGFIGVRPTDPKKVPAVSTEPATTTATSTASTTDAQAPDNESAEVITSDTFATDTASTSVQATDPTTRSQTNGQ